MNKSELRRHIQLKSNQVSKDSLEKISNQICEHLISSHLIRKASTIAAYRAFSTEVNLNHLIQDAWSKNKKVFFPKTHDASLLFYQALDNTPFKKDALGFETPLSDVELDVSQLDLILVPGLAFNEKGHRLGRGKGFYDRFLNRLPNRCVKVGIVPSFALLQNLPIEVHDVKMNVLVSEREVIFCD